MARILLTAGQTFGTIGAFTPATQVFGTSESETVLLTADANAVFSGSFSGDTLQIDGAAGAYNAVLEGSNVVLTSDNGARIVIPVDVDGDGVSVAFSDGIRQLTFDDASGSVSLGDQVITTTEAPVTPGSGGSGSGNVFTLTFGTDELTGTDGSDTFNAPLQPDGAGNLTQTLDSSDILDGGAGDDTLNAVLNGTAVDLVADSIETINLRATGAASTVSLNVTDGGAVWSDRSTQDLTLDNASGTLTYGLHQTTADLDVNLAAASTTLNLALDAAGSAADAVAVTVGGAGGVTDLTVDVTGDNYADLSGVGTVTDLTVTGTGSLTLAAGAIDAGVDTIDASDNSGGVDIDLTGAGAVDVTFTGGSGDDRLVIENFDANDTLAGGTGQDTLAITADDAGGVTGDNVTGFETLELHDAATGAVSLDFDDTGFTQLILADDLTVAGPLTVDNFSGGEIVLGAAQAGSIDVLSVGDADSITITTDAGAAITAADISVADIESVTFSSASAADDLTVTDLDISGVTSLSVTGAGDFNVTNFADDGSLHSIDFTGQTGNIDLADDIGHAATYELGDFGSTGAATADVDGDGTNDAVSSITLGAASQNVVDTFEFTSDFHGFLEITGAQVGGDVTDDQFDFSALGVSSIDDLVFTEANAGADTLITSDAFSGGVYLVGVATNEVNNADFTFA